MVQPSLHTGQCEFNVSTRRLLGLLLEGMDHDELLPRRRERDGAGNAVLPVHPDFPEFALQVCHMWLRDSLGAKVLEHLRNAQEVGAHVRRQTLDFGFGLFGNLDMPAHRTVYHFWYTMPRGHSEGCPRFWVACKGGTVDTLMPKRTWMDTYPHIKAVLQGDAFLDALFSDHPHPEYYGCILCQVNHSLIEVDFGPWDEGEHAGRAIPCTETRSWGLLCRD